MLILCFCMLVNVSTNMLIAVKQNVPSDTSRLQIGCFGYYSPYGLFLSW